MHERKALMAELADAFVALPGGLGTLEELFEVYTWSQLGLHARPCALLDVEGYYAGVAAFLDHAVARALPAREHRELLIVEASPRPCSSGSERFEPAGRRAEVDRPRGELTVAAPR